MNTISDYQKDYTPLKEHLKRTGNGHPIWFEALKTAFDIGYSQGFEHGWSIANDLHRIANECGVAMDNEPQTADNTGDYYTIVIG